MQVSFFKKNFFTVIERSIVDENLIAIEKKEILQAYDFSAWKLTANSKLTQIPSLSERENKMCELKKKHNSPFGICVTTADDVKIASKYASFLYIPGEFCRQADVLAEAKNAQIPLVVEKGVFLAPNDIKRLCEKIQGADFCLVECGSANGYSDSILDPRSLMLMQQNSSCFGISLSDLLSPEGTHYAHRPQWLGNHEFMKAFIKTGKAFQASFYVTKNNAHDQFNAEQILEMVR
ncbi:MAG: hypothetical protein V4591_07035 [Bdellovibrionota bacterium]